MEEVLHRPVFLAETLTLLAPRPGGLYVDGTVGDGGHTRELLRACAPGGRVAGFDRDAEALGRARARIVEEGTLAASEVFLFEDGAVVPAQARLVLFHRNYARVAESLREAGLGLADGILLDLGVSTLQLLAPERGFSFRADGPIDMRMNASGDDEPTAADVLAGLEEHELVSVLREYGEERFAKRIARAIVNARDAGELTGTAALADVVYRATPPAQRFGHTHPATRTFQALRIATNRELDFLQEALGAVMEALAPGGTAVVLTYHSLEDRICKHTFRAAAREGRVADLTKHPLRPTPEEVERNARARSAKLRAVRRAA